ncbi:MAG: glycosyltransferase [Saprospiraceae bacterium]
MSFLVVRNDNYSYLVITTTILALFVLIQVIFWWQFYSTILSFKSSDSCNNQPFVSVLICAKNEEKNIRNCILSIIDQEYPSFEIIVMDDFSTDGTFGILQDLLAQGHEIILQKPEKDQLGKKHAIAQGVSLSNGQWLLLTDADCIPKTNQWIASMMQKSTPNKDLVLGYGAYIKEPRLLNKIIRYETYYIALQYFTSAINSRAYMGVGRNLAFRKSAFINNMPFRDFTHASGDDDAIVQSLAKDDNVGICINKNGFTYSNPKNTLRQYFGQKRRHISPSLSYSLLHQWKLGILGGTHVSVYALALISFLLGNWTIPVILLAVRWILIALVSKKLLQIFSEKNLLTFIPILDLFLAIFYFFQLLCIPFKKKNW